jgi:hypothetical protein
LKLAALICVHGQEYSECDLQGKFISLEGDGSYAGKLEKYNSDRRKVSWKIKFIHRYIRF